MTIQGESKRVQIAKLHAEGKSQRQISKEIGLAQSTVCGHLKVLKETGAFPSPEGFSTKSTSTLFDEEGNVRLQWVKSDVDKEKRERAEKAAFEALCETLPKVAPVEGPVVTQEELLNLYILTDCHIGALAWSPECGEDWDTQIAESTLIKTFQSMISRSPHAKKCIIGQLGDFLHFDGLLAVTPLHRNILDADSRFSKVVAVAIRVLRYVIDMALRHHDTVYVLMADANHDPASQVWLRHMFSALYENEPRVIVNNSEKTYYAYQHGKTMIGFHHGHMVKNEKLPLLLATLYPKIWGATEHRYVHIGHRHHVDEKEENGMKTMQHPTIAAKDAYAARGGWLAKRQASCLTYHTLFGEVARTVVTPEMFSDAP